jgi:cytochrome P450
MHLYAMHTRSIDEGYRQILHRRAHIRWYANTLVCMQVDRFSVTMEPDLGAAVREAAERAGMSVSGWLAQAAADRLRNDLLGAALDAWEAEEGPFGDEELDAAAATLGITRGSRGHAA